MNLKNHKSFMCPQSASSNKPFGCKGLKCAAFRVYHLSGSSINEMLKDRMFVCGLVKSFVSCVQLDIQKKEIEYFKLKSL
jgi:hypothetical protein